MSADVKNQPATSTTSSSRLASLRSQLGAVDELIIASVLRSTSSGSVQGSKEPLSLQQTSANFRRFVQKSGPIFVAQDAAEAVLRWEDGPKSLFFAAVWGFICWYPYLVLMVPNMFLIATLLHTHRHKTRGSLPGEQLNGMGSPAPPVEGSVDYLANLQNIQIMMGRISDLSDLGRSLAPYLSWHDDRISLLLLQLSVVSGALLLMAAPYIPWRLVLFLVGETVLFLGHPWARPLLLNALPFIRQSSGALLIKSTELLEDDALLDSELACNIITIERFEVETRQDSATWAPDVVIGGELPKGYSWLRVGDWTVDSTYSDGQVDQAGYLYLHLDGSTSSTFVTTNSSGETLSAQSRRRRWVRRALCNKAL